jgi:hypothetical protein
MSHAKPNLFFFFSKAPAVYEPRQTMAENDKIHYEPLLGDSDSASDIVEHQSEYLPIAQCKPNLLTAILSEISLAETLCHLQFDYFLCLNLFFVSIHCHLPACHRQHRYSARNYPILYVYQTLPLFYHVECRCADRSSRLMKPSPLAASNQSGVQNISLHTR